MRRPFRWLLAGGGVIVALAVALALALPSIVKWVAIRNARVRFHRELSIDSVRLNLFTGFFEMRGFRAADRVPGPPWLEVEDITARLRLIYLLRLRLVATEISFSAPTVRLVRLPSGELNVADLGGGGGGGGGGLPIILRLEHLLLTRGAFHYEDRAVTPARLMSATDVELELTNITDQRDAREGTARLAFKLDGAGVSGQADQIGLAPGHVRGSLKVLDGDLAPWLAYVTPGAAIRAVAGRLTTDLGFRYDPVSGFRLDGEAVVTGVRVDRAGQRDPFVTAPSLRLVARDFAPGGGFGGEQLELTASPTIVWDTAAGSGTVQTGSAPPAPGAAGGLGSLATKAAAGRPAAQLPRPAAGDRASARRYGLRGLRVRVDGLDRPAGSPGRLTLAAGLPGSATLDVRGQVDPGWRAVALDLSLTNGDLDLIRPYLPADPTVGLGGGRLDAALKLAASTAPSLGADGTLTCRDCVLMRRGQAEPFVKHPRLRATIQGFAWRTGSLRVGRLDLEDSPSVVDASVSPPVRLDFRRLALTVEDAAWPSRGRARVRGAAALADGSRSTLEGTVDPETLESDVKVTFGRLDLRTADAYVPRASPARLEAGKLDATVALRYARATGVRLDVEGAVADLGVRLRSGPVTRLSDSRLALGAQGLVFRAGAMGFAGLRVAGAPVLDTPGGGAPRVVLNRLELGARDFGWPAVRPMPVRAELSLRDGGTTAITGAVDLRTGVLTADVRLQGMALGGLAGRVPIAGPLGGALDATLTLSARSGDAVQARVRGEAAARDLALGPPGRPAASLGRVQVSGVEVDWPQRIRLGRVAITNPSILLEREKDGRFPVREMLAPPVRADAGEPANPSRPADIEPAGGPPTDPRSATRPRMRGPGAGAPPAALASRGAAGAPPGVARVTPARQVAAAPPAGLPGAPSPTSPAGPGARFGVEIGELALDDGRLRFVDESIEPPFSEELSRVALRLRDLTTASPRPGDVQLQALMGATGAIDLHGQIAPGADPFVLDLEGEIRQFPLRDTNPYFRRVFDWLLQRGSLTTRVHYRIVGDKLDAKNTVRLERLGVERDPAPLPAERKIGLPLGMIVALATDQRGDLAFDLPVSGSLRAPGFSLGGAISAALRNVLVNVLAAPFRAIGKVFGRGSAGEEFRVDPVVFVAGEVALTKEGVAHLERLAEVLHGAPNTRLTLRAVLSDDDLVALRTEAVAARVQARQRLAGLPSFEAAAVALLREAVPDTPPPSDPVDVMAQLRARQPVPDEAARQLAASRLETVRKVLGERGIAGERLGSDPERTALGDPGAGRVEVELEAAAPG